MRILRCHVKAPSFQFYADDFIGGTASFSQAETGAYVRLLCYQWGNGFIPSALEKMKNVAGGEVTEDVLAKFPVWPDGKRRNERLENVRHERADFIESQREKGRKGAKKRWAKDSRGHPPDINGPIAGPMAHDSSPVSSLQSPNNNKPNGELLLDDYALNGERPCTKKPNSLPPSLDNPTFRKVWSDFIMFRKQARKPLTPISEQRMWEKLSRHPLSTVIATVELSIERGWLGVFPEAVINKQPATVTPSKPVIEESDEAFFERTGMTKAEAAQIVKCL